MPGFLRQATASQSRAIGIFVDDTDFKTPETGLTIANTDIKLVVNGGASANKNSGGGTHRVNGVYGVTFDATDTATVGEMEVSVVVSGALPVFDKFFVIEEAVYDALFAASAPGYLQPTTAGRTLDVSAGGEAGIDWANIGSPTTAQNLSGTSTKAVEPTVAGRTLDVSTGGEAGVDWANIGSPTTTVNLSGTSTKAVEPTVAGRTLDVSAGGEAGVDWANVGSPTATVGLTNTTVGTLTTYTGNTPQTGDGFARLGAPVGASISADIAGVQADTDNIQTRLPAALVSGRMDSSLGAVAGAASNIKKNQALAKFEFVMTDSTTHNPQTGLSVTATRSIDGAAFGACTNAVVELASGVYYIDLAAADLNGNVITLRFTAAAADDRLITIITQP